MDFADILKLNNLEPESVRLVRHPSGFRDFEDLDETPFWIWKNDSEKYKLLNSSQKKNAFKNQKYLASFVGTHTGDTLFTTIYGIGKQKGTWYELTYDKRLKQYEGKLTVQWGSERSWSQVGGRTPKKVISLGEELYEPPFPGFARFTWMSENISSIYPTWKEVLKTSKGTYILVETKSGQQYVGSATGRGGFYGRWLEYEENGHGGNKMLKKLKNPIYKVGILEVASSIDSRDEIIRRESVWKEKLGSRTFGLNIN